MIRWFAEQARRLRGGIALGYVVVLMAAPMADAAIEAITLDEISHVERETDESCYSGHDEVMCQLCRLIEVPGHASARLTQPDAVRNHHRVTRPASPLGISRDSATRPPARAPPAV